MGSKFTRQQAETVLRALANQKQEIIDSGYVEEIKLIASHSYIDKGNTVSEHHCHKCGNVFTTDGRYSSYSYRRPAITCPSCGNTHITYSTFAASNKDSLYIKEQDYGFDFVLYSTHYQFPEGERWYEKDAVTDISINYCGMFHNEGGWFVYDVRYDKMLKRDCMAESDLLKRIAKLTPINPLTRAYADLLDDAQTFEDARRFANAKKKANSKTTTLEEMRFNYRPKAVEEADIMAQSHNILYEVYSTKNGVTTWMTCCTNCGTEREVLANSGELTCPVCGNQMNSDGHRGYYGSGRTTSISTYVIFENTNLPENDLLLRVFNVQHTYDTAKGLESNVWEYQRIFFGKKINVYNIGSRHSHSTTPKKEKGSIRDLSHSLNGWRCDAKTIQADEEIRDIIRNSCLMFSGLVESYGLGDKRYRGVEPAPSVKYIMAWYKNPNIELIMKANMITILDRLMQDPALIGTGNTLADALMVAPAVAKMAAKLDLDHGTLSNLSAMYNADNTLTAEQFKHFMDAGLQAHSLVQLKTTYNISYAQADSYLQSAYNHQCIEKREAMTLWLDYLRMATALKIDLNDKTRKYPGSLKKEHDVATFAYRAVQIEIDKEQFATQAEQNAFYEYSYKDLVVVIPRTPQDIVEEATKQKNCLRSYVERVKNGDTVVAFIRRKIMPDATYVTAEVHDGRLTQLKGYCNSNPRNKELVEFVQHWAKAKGIRVDC